MHVFLTRRVDNRERPSELTHLVHLINACLFVWILLQTVEGGLRSFVLKDFKLTMVVGGMGVRPRSPTSAVRSFAGISELVQLIVESRQQVIFVTGAAFASSSGLVPFRDETVSSPELKRLQERYDSREVYDKNPLVWWNEFWLPLYRVKDQDVNRPNVGHFAIAYMAEHFVNVSVVTLCIDSLHKKAGVSEEKMAHAFGRASDYHCLGQCDSVSSERIKLDLKQNGDLERLPHCPDCHCQVVPVPAFKPWGYTIAEGATVVVVGCSSESLSRLSKDVPNRRVYVIADGVDSEEEKASSIRVIKGPPCKLLAVIAATLERLGEVEGMWLNDRQGREWL